jgi:hypothetical protein
MHLFRIDTRGIFVRLSRSVRQLNKRDEKNTSTEMKRTCVRYILFVLLSCIVLASSEPKEEAFEEASELKPNSFGAVDLVDMKYIYEIWEPEIAEVAQVIILGRQWQ